MVYRSEHLEDQWILKHLDLPDNGVFVDVGAGHPVRHNNTHAFEQLGWTGILIEPDPRREFKIKEHRKAQLFVCAAGSDDRVATLALTEHPDSSRVAAGQADSDIKAWHSTTERRLVSICREAQIRRIDLISIDTNGTELDVWQGLSLGSNVINPAPTPAVVIINHVHLGVADIVRRLCADGYALVRMTDSNLIFYSVADMEAR